MKPGCKWRFRAFIGNDTEVSMKNIGCFDELAVDDWLHIEQMDDRVWVMEVGDARIAVEIAKNGTATVNIERGECGEIRGWTEARA